MTDRISLFLTPGGDWVVTRGAQRLTIKWVSDETHADTMCRAAAALNAGG